MTRAKNLKKKNTGVTVVRDILPGDNCLLARLLLIIPGRKYSQSYSISTIKLIREQSILIRFLWPNYAI